MGENVALERQECKEMFYGDAGSGGFVSGSGIEESAEKQTLARTEIGFRRLNMQPELLDWLLGEDIFNYSSEEAKLESNFFDNCIDYPQIPKHRYSEGYFHALKTSAPHQQSLHARKGTLMQKPPAPARLRAFLCAFRRLNKSYIENISHVDGHEKWNEFMKDKANHCFADVSVQTHYGDGVQGEHLGWHRDNFNSVLHMAIAVRGHRALHYEVAPEQGSKSMGERVAWMSPGDIYISSPCAFRHAVEYPSTDWESRIIAVQCRMLFTVKDFDEFFVGNSVNYGEQKVLSSVANALYHGDLQVPDLSDVKTEYRRLVADTAK